MQEPEHAAGMLVKEIEVRGISREAFRFTLERRTYGLETFQLLAQRDTAFQKSRSRLEAIPVLRCLIDEIGQGTQAEKQHKRLPGLE